MTKFNHLNIPDQWNTYWSKYPQGYTILEALINWVGQVDSMVDNQNQLNDNVVSYKNDINNTITDYRNELDAFVLQFDAELQETVSETLTAWQLSGYLEVIISAALQTQIDEVDDRLSTQLAHIALRRVDVNAYATVADAITEVTARKLSGQTPILWFSPRNTDYETLSTITVPTGVHVIMDEPLVYTGTAEEPCLVVEAQGQRNFSVNLTIRVTRQTQSDWLDENNIGVVIYNANTANIYIAEATNFTIGFQAIGSSGGFAYNNVEIGLVMNNKFSLDLTNETSTGGVGWCNENRFVGGRYGDNTGVGIGLSRYGVRITSKDGTYLANNNNVFEKPSFELNQSTAGAGEAIPILIEHGFLNKFESCRDEGNNSTFVRLLNDSQHNDIDIGYTSILTDITAMDDRTARANNMLSIRNKKLLESGTVVFNSGKLVDKACYYDTSNINVSGVMLAGGSIDMLRKFLPTSTLSINVSYLEFLTGRGVGVCLDSKKSKRFVIKMDVETGYGGRTYIRCYDVAGNILTNTGINHPYVRGTSNFIFNAGYGGSYGTAVDSGRDMFFKVHDDVKTIHVMITEGTNNLRIRGFQVISLDGYCSAFTGYEEIINGVNLGTVVPTLGTYGKGKVVLNDNKTELGTSPNKYVIEGWECIVSGTPGTWIEKRSLTGN